MKNNLFSLVVFVCFFLTYNQTAFTQTNYKFKEIKGKVFDGKTNDPLIFADLSIKNSNIGTITNSDGDFALKVPDSLLGSSLIITHLGYEQKEVNFSFFENNQKIGLTPVATELREVEIAAFKDPQALLKLTLKNRSTVYNDNNTLMTAFYRETIKKRRRNASLSEAVVQIHKEPYTNSKRDAIELVKARKSTNYTLLDTIAVKLQGGPFSNIYIDIIKYPEFIFSPDDFSLYDFEFDASTKINDNQVYVINFKQKPNVITPLYFGTLYIDSKTLGLTNAVYSLNVENRELSSEMYIRKKPRQVEVYPTEATYRVNYRTQNGKWHYAYSNIMLTFKVNWKGKLFNNIYTLNSEMAITDWSLNKSNVALTRDKILRPTTILTDEASGFSDPSFWGEYNIIEPEKSIESAIEKIKKQLKKESE